MSDRYREFLAGKHLRPISAGFEPDASLIPDGLFVWQRRIVEWSVRQGRCAIWAGCGLGKTAMQLTWAEQVVRHTGKPVLVLTPLAVAPQTVREGAKFGLQAKQIASQSEVSGPGIYVSNYQKLLAGRFDADEFAGLVADESSCLKNYTGKTKQLLCDSFEHTPYKLACSATPAPNDHMELGNHSEFLGIMPSSEMLMRWFVVDQSKVGTYRLKGHAADDFWRWIASWAICLDKPSDIGFSDDGFDIPPIEYHQHTASVDPTLNAPTGMLFRSGSLTATSIHQEMRLTAAARAEIVAGLVNSSWETWVVWCNTDYEADELVERIPDAIEVRGSQPDHVKERLLQEFTDGKHRVIISKPSLAGLGLNWQHCRNAAFVGLSYSHEAFFQAVRRIWRFGQTYPVHIHMVIADSEGEVLAAIRRKEESHDEMRARLVGACREVLERGSTRGYRKVEMHVEKAETWTMYNADCVEACREIPDDHVHLSVFSPPFSNLYIYSDSDADMGNSASDEEFFQHFRFLIPELLRVTVPGRLCAVHCKDLPKYAGRDGIAGLKDFPGMIIREFEDAGWSYHSRVTIWKCPVTERERTNNNGLLHKTVTRDSSQIRQGMADYLLVFRKYPREGDGLMAAEPIVRPTGLARWVGDEADNPLATSHHPSPTARKKRPSDPSIALWQRYAEPVWWDIDQMDVLDYQSARAAGDERHICALQLGLIRRVVELWSQPGEVVFSPFAGIGSEGFVSVQERRRFVGVELKRNYFEAACKHLAQAEREANQKDLFSDLPVEAAP